MKKSPSRPNRPALLLRLVMGLCAFWMNAENLRAEEASKIQFDLSALDVEGLRGPPDGKVAVDYEFCIPDTPERRAQVLAIDRSVKFMPGSRGRIGCGPGTVLCIGNTHQPNAVAVLHALAAFPWIPRIQECVWE